MAVDRSSNNQATSGSGMSTALATSEEERIKRQQELGEEASTGASSGPATIGGSSATQTSAPVKAMPKQQKAGTGSFANLKSYLQAAQGGGQQRVAQAATQQVQKLGTGAQKGVQQAQESFGRQMQAGSGAVFQGEQGQALSQEEASSRAQQRAQEAINAARAVTYQAPQVTAQAEGEAPTQAPVPAQPQQYFTPEQQQRFAEIINAQYQGPASLQQAGLYEQAARKARAAQQAGELTQTAGGREQLLRDVFGRGRDYSRGASRLDALLLNASEQGVQQLQQQAQPALQAQQALQEAQNISANEAAQRAAAIEQIRSGARTAFTEARTAEEQAAQDYIQSVQQNWNKLPEYFKQVLQESATSTPEMIGDLSIQNSTDWMRNQYLKRLGKQASAGKTYNLSAEEAAILGLTPGQGLFGISPEVIQAAPIASPEEIITKDQLTRQLALAQLAKLDRLGGLQKDLLTTDLEKAGTKNILSSVDTKKLRDIQEESRKGLEQRLQNISGGVGYDSGGRLVRQNYLDLLKGGGYVPQEQISTDVQANQDLLRSIAEGSAYSPAEEQQLQKGYLQRIFESEYDKKFRDLKPLTSSIAELGNILGSYGGLDTAQIVENEQTKARAAALRQLLSGIYKK